MKILFIHQSFPAQFKSLAIALASDPANQVLAIHLFPTFKSSNGIQSIQYRVTRSSSKTIHPWLSDLETKINRGHEVLKVLVALKQNGFTPDLVIAHPGWGESLYVKDVWAKTKLIIYGEFFYRANNSDINFDKEFHEDDIYIESRIRTKNSFYSIQLPTIDAILAPTQWQKSTFPQNIQSMIYVNHEGIDTEYFAPNANVILNLRQGSRQLQFSKNDELLTFVNRNLEPYRGYHVFMRALPKILKERPNCKVLIIGGSGVSYGKKPEGKYLQKGKSWKEIFLNEVISELDMSRVFFLDFLPYEHYRAALRISTVHVYLTYPFVLSWSLIEAMSVGCSIVANNVEPVKEVIEHNKNGLLIDMFNKNDLTETVIELLNNRKKRNYLSVQARAYAKKNFDQRTHCLPQLMKWVKEQV